MVKEADRTTHADEQQISTPGIWEVHVQMRLVTPLRESSALCERLDDVIDSTFEFVPSAIGTGSGPALTATTAGGTFQVEAPSPGQAVDIAVPQTEQAMRATLTEIRGLAEITVLPGGIDPRTI
ncbi:hypothetical protein ACFWRZ_00595 [Streptomyces rubiginosohelvolus]|uniref:hypothetical protein n=1 Tax=Streptomyces rubiginosohelvolus TaxID=67362 RepID=UPI003658B565